MAYHAEHDRIRALLPDGFVSLRPVLRINVEARGEKEVYVEFNTPVTRDGFHGWLNICNWLFPAAAAIFSDNGGIDLHTGILDINFAPVGIGGGCPAENNNDGCIFFGKEEYVRHPESISANKEFCDCEFRWKFDSDCAHGKSIGKTLPAFSEEVKNIYPKRAFTPENAAAIPCDMVLGSYMVEFERL